MNNHLYLLRAAVEAKLAYWNAMRALELALVPHDVDGDCEWPDDESAEEEISGLAAACPKDDAEWLTDDELHTFRQLTGIQL
jgi:hypothetical protein